MAVKGAQTGAPCGSCETQGSSGCVDKFGCPPDMCPDFVIKRHDTKPPFRVSVEDCDGALDLTDDTLVLEINMWARGKLKAAITNTDTFFALADNIGFCQAMVGDIIVMERVRSPEHMLVTGFDENNKLIRVQRGYNGTSAVAWLNSASIGLSGVFPCVCQVHNCQFPSLTHRAWEGYLFGLRTSHSGPRYDAALLIAGYGVLPIERKS